MLQYNLFWYNMFNKSILIKKAKTKTNSIRNVGYNVVTFSTFLHKIIRNVMYVSIHKQLINFQNYFDFLFQLF
jgi:hypothetical protein